MSEPLWRGCVKDETRHLLALHHFPVGALRKALHHWLNSVLHNMWDPSYPFQIFLGDHILDLSS